MKFALVVVLLCLVGAISASTLTEKVEDTVARTVVRDPKSIQVTVSIPNFANLFTGITISAVTLSDIFALKTNLFTLG